MAQQEFVLTQDQADEAKELIEAMREAVNSVPSYVDLQAAKARQENREEQDIAA